MTTSKWERRSVSTVNKPSPKPSPFSSLLSIKRRRMPGDTGVTDTTSELGHIDQPPPPEEDLGSLPESDADPTGQPPLPSIQVLQAVDGAEQAMSPGSRSYQTGSTLELAVEPGSQAGAPAEQPSLPDSRLHQAGATAEHSASPDSRAGGLPAQPVPSDIQTFVSADAPPPHQTVTDNEATVT